MDRKAFFDIIRDKTGALTMANVVGFDLVLDEAHARNTPLEQLAYILATGWWESGKTMAPVREAYYLGSKAEAFRKKLRYYPFYGRGLVQLTWEDNYAKASKLVGEDLVSNPDRALDPKISVKILFDGMERGWFTGKKLDDYIDNKDEVDKEDLREYANARRIVNGTDKQIEIAHLALVFERALRAAYYGIVTAEPTPSAAPTPSPAPAKKSPGLIAAAVAGLTAIVAWFTNWLGWW